MAAAEQSGAGPPQIIEERASADWAQIRHLPSMAPAVRFRRVSILPQAAV